MLHGKTDKRSDGCRKRTRAMVAQYEKRKKERKRNAICELGGFCVCCHSALNRPGIWWHKQPRTGSTNHHPRHAKRNAGICKAATPALHLSSRSLRPAPTSVVCRPDKCKQDLQFHTRKKHTIDCWAETSGLCLQSPMPRGLGCSFTDTRPKRGRKWVFACLGRALIFSRHLCALSLLL